MVETVRTLDELEVMTESQLEQVIEREPVNADNARYTLGRLQVEGTFPESVPRNEKKGINWIKTAVKNGNMLATEFKVYYDIRFARSPDLKKIEETLHFIAEKGHSARAFNTLAEFAHAQNKKEGFKEEAAKYYNKSAEMGCLIGTHWMGVFYQEGFGVSKNLDKAVEMLKRAAKLGNAQSDFQLFLLYSREEEKKNAALAYKHLARAVSMGVTFFDQMHEYFKDNYDALAEQFLKVRKPEADPTKEVK
jgi:TPR repeat protein